MRVENTPESPTGDSPASETTVRGASPHGASRRATGPRREETPRLLGVALGVYSAMAGIAVVAAAFAGRSPFYASPAAAAAVPSLAADVAAGLAAGLVMVVLSRQLTRRTRSGVAMARALAEVLGPVSFRDAVVLATLSGVAEELLFRGLLQPMIGWVAASLLFGAAHIAPRRDLWLWTGTSVLAGFVLGALFERTGNLAAPIVAHFTVNAANLRWLAVEYGGSAERGERLG